MTQHGLRNHNLLFSLIISSPKGGTSPDNPLLDNDEFFRYTKPGKLQRCLFTFESTRNQCININPPPDPRDDEKDIVSAESLGLSLAVHPENVDKTMVSRVQK